MKRATRFLSMSGLTLLAAGVVSAAGPQPRVVLKVDVKEEVSESDSRGVLRVVQRPVERADPGDILVYTLTYTNTGDGAAATARVEDPIPPGTILVPGSVLAADAGATFSIDGGRSFVPYPATMSVAGKDGKPVTVEVPPEKYTHIRWVAAAPMAPGETRTASFKVIVR